MYHAHIDETREEIGGMEGALIVRDRGAVRSPDDHVFLLKGNRGNLAHPLEIDGQASPDTVVLHVGRPARLRFINLAAYNTPAPTFFVTARTDSAAQMPNDTLVVRWVPLAKDAFDSSGFRSAWSERERVASHAIGHHRFVRACFRRPAFLALRRCSMSARSAGDAWRRCG